MGCVLAKDYNSTEMANSLFLNFTLCSNPRVIISRTCSKVEEGVLTALELEL